MKKKLLAVLLSFMMVLSLGVSSFAAETMTDDILDMIENMDSVKVEIGIDKMTLNKTTTYTVDRNASLIVYNLNLTSDKSVKLNYNSTSTIFGIGVVNSLDEVDMNNAQDSVTWIDMLQNYNGKASGEVDLKLKKGANAIAVLATTGDYEVTANTTSTLKTMSPFTVNSITPSSTYVSGKGVAGAEVVVMDSKLNTYKTTVKSDNTFKISIPKQEEYSSLIVRTSKKGYGAKVKIVDVEYKYFNTFIVNQVKSTSTYVTGKGKSGATVAAYVGSKKIGSSTVKSDGTYSIKIPKQSSGTKVKVKMSKSGYMTEDKTITVKKVFAKALTVNQVKPTSTYVTGNGSKGATVKAYVGSKEIGKSTVKSNGTYSIKIPKQSKGKVITVKMSKTGFATSSKSKTVK